ncbi:hypothetical protein H4W80_008361 [Nonomuraea angiospora]|uniref:Uncharacterized protein n=1 Tax=Nonomuraea angiospora TaxID=46172 RepID=A0ABR9MB15_9ACTN|nr:hypothetical protein [Nonomuraea angiospora]
MLLAPATLSPSKINDNDVNDCLWITGADCLVSVDNLWVFVPRTQRAVCRQGAAGDELSKASVKGG